LLEVHCSSRVVVAGQPRRRHKPSDDGAERRVATMLGSGDFFMNLQRERKTRDVGSSLLRKRDENVRQPMACQSEDHRDSTRRGDFRLVPKELPCGVSGGGRRSPQVPTRSLEDNNHTALHSVILQLIPSGSSTSVIGRTLRLPTCPLSTSPPMVLPLRRATSQLSMLHSLLEHQAPLQPTDSGLSLLFRLRLSAPSKMTAEKKVS
jgi:hypothetical protein